jgi:hypothetical protein
MGGDFQKLVVLSNLERIEFKSANNCPQPVIFENLDQFPKLKKLVIFDCRSITTDAVVAARASKNNMPEIEFTPSTEETVTECDSDDEN